MGAGDVYLQPAETVYNNIKGTKRYLQPKDMILNAIHDLAEIQKAKTLMCDSPNGIVNLLVTMYAIEREYRFTVTEIGGSRSEVAIELISGEPDKRRLIDIEMALLDYALKDKAKIDLAEIEKWDRELGM
jgi:hypothetical protein